MGEVHKSLEEMRMNGVMHKLEMLEPGQTLDAEGLDKSEVDSLIKIYSKGYAVRKMEEEKGSGRYAVNFTKLGAMQNA